jgi:K+-transporting ATPase ATPase B chain
MDRLVQRNVLATSGRAVEAAGDVDTLLLDKTGTITFGNRRATALIPAPGVGEAELATAARLSSLADPDPGGPQHRRAVRRRSRPSGGGDARRRRPPSSSRYGTHPDVRAGRRRARGA